MILRVSIPRLNRANYTWCFIYGIFESVTILGDWVHKLVLSIAISTLPLHRYARLDETV